MNKLVIGIFALIVFTSCSKDTVNPDEIAPKDIKKQLEAYDWIPTIVMSDGKNELHQHRPEECELDNRYTFSFGKDSQKMLMDAGTQSCGEDQFTFEKVIFDGANSRTFTYDKDKNSIKFIDSQYDSYGVLIDGDYLVLTSRNNNPTAYVKSIEYHFKGKSKTVKN